MLKAISIVFALFMLFASCTQPMYAATKGVVSKRISGCDYFIVDATRGYAVLEWYGGHDPDSDDVLIGNFETYGMHDIVDDTADETVTVYTEDFALSRTRALEILVDKCGE